ncbi:putative oxidoreductase [Nocardioides sp. LS1]|nr:putative oxidoreductase [Nocardioides sp. LS1]
MIAARRWVATRPGGLEHFSLEQYDVPVPEVGEVTIEVRAAGVNPADHKHAAGGNASEFPKPIGYEVAGVLAAIPSRTQIASGGGTVGQEVLAFRVAGGWSSHVTVRASDVFAKPDNLSFAEAANLLLAGTTASEMLHVTGVSSGETIVVHGGSGAVGVAVLQLARRMGVRVVATCGQHSFERVRGFGAEPVRYGDGLVARLQAAAPEGIAASLDCVGTDEAVSASTAVVADRGRIVTIASAHRATTEGFHALAGSNPVSATYRNGVRSRLIEAAAAGEIEVPVARTFPLEAAPDALRVLLGLHPGGKLALVT